VSALADLSITKTVDEDTPNVGQNVTFTITVTNNGPSPATNIVVLDELPTGYTYVSHDNSGVGSVSVDENEVTWEVAALANGQSVILTIEVTVNATGNYA